MGKKKVRVQLRKNRAKPPRANDLTRAVHADAEAAGDAVSGERVRAKGELSRHRTVDAPGPAGPAADGTRPGRVLRIHGLNSYVEADDGRVVRCGRPADAQDGGVRRPEPGRHGGCRVVPPRVLRPSSFVPR